MSWNYKKIALFSILFLSITFFSIASELSVKHVEPRLNASNESVAKERRIAMEGLSEDEWILRAIWLEENAAFEKSAEVYSKLYIATEKKEYLFKEVSSRIYAGGSVGESLQKLKKWTTTNPNNLAGRRLLLALYMNEKLYKEAAQVGAYLLEHSDEDADLELAANPYIFSGNYKKGVELLNKLYRNTKNEKILMKIAAINAQYLGENKKAIQILETHRRMENASPDIYKMLIDLYVKEQNIDRILETYRALYKQDAQVQYLSKIIEIYVYNRDFNSLILFLESNHANDDILYDLYKKEKQFKKAIKLTEVFYLQNHNPKWLAEKAILIFEVAKDKDDRKMLDKLITLFDEAFLLGVDDSLYLNYYGYTLIDKEIDIDRGMKIIKEALSQQPDNSYYLDSLAWGYYKKDECLKAYATMEKVVEKEGLDELEIKEHWEKIQACQKPVILGRK